MAAMRLNRMVRTAVRLIKGLRVRQSAEDFEIAILSGILWFKVVERYPLNGGVRQFKRRDLRRGVAQIPLLGSQYILPVIAVCHPAADAAARNAARRFLGCLAIRLMPPA